MKLVTGHFWVLGRALRCYWARGNARRTRKWAGRPFVLLGREKEQCGCGLDQQLGQNGKV
jgi:hypothetical protein